MKQLLVNEMRVYGDLLEIQPHFLSMMDFKLQYSDVYCIDMDGSDEIFDAERAMFIEELCLAYECIDLLEDIGTCVGFDVSFWEDDE